MYFDATLPMLRRVRSRSAGPSVLRWSLCWTLATCSAPLKSKGSCCRSVCTRLYGFAPRQERAGVPHGQHDAHLEPLKPVISIAYLQHAFSRSTVWRCSIPSDLRRAGHRAQRDSCGARPPATRARRRQNVKNHGCDAAKSKRRRMRRGEKSCSCDAGDCGRDGMQDGGNACNCTQCTRQENR